VNPVISGRSLAPLILALLLALPGCPGDDPVPDDDDDDDATAPDDDDDDDVTSLDLQVEVSEVIPTVATLRWTTSQPADATVTFGPGEPSGTTLSDPADGELDHEVVLFGLLPATEYSVAVTLIDAQEGQATANFTTGAVPTSLPTLSVQILDEEVAPDGYLLTSLLTSPLSVVLLDTDGTFLWWHFDERDQTAIGRVRLSADGEAILYDTFPTYGADPDDPTHEIIRVSLDGTDVEVLDTPGHHHDFAQLDDGTLAYLAEDRRDVEGEEIIGDQLVELRPDGSHEVVWTAWDDIPYDPADVPPGSDWTHCGALFHDPVEDAYYLSSHNLDAIWKVDRATGELIWTFGGPRSDFTVAEPGALPYHQHQLQVLDDHLLVFDNREPQTHSSRVVEYRLDGWLATEVWAYEAEPPIYNFAMGDAHRLDGDVTLITWSTAGQMDVVGADDDLVWRLNLDLGSGFSYVTWMTDLYGAN
jgi:hypothetical protein